MILQCGFFCSLVFLMFNIMSVFHFSCLSSVKKIIPPASNKRSLVGQLCIYKVIKCITMIRKATKHRFTSAFIRTQLPPHKLC